MCVCGFERGEGGGSSEVSWEVSSKVKGRTLRRPLHPRSVLCLTDGVDRLADDAPPKEAGGDKHGIVE